MVMVESGDINIDMYMDMGLFIYLLFLGVSYQLEEIESRDRCFVIAYDSRCSCYVGYR